MLFHLLRWYRSAPASLLATPGARLRRTIHFTPTDMDCSSTCCMALHLFQELYYLAHHENLGSIEERGILSHSLTGLAGGAACGHFGAGSTAVACTARAGVWCHHPCVCAVVFQPAQSHAVCAPPPAARSGGAACFAQCSQNRRAGVVHRWQCRLPLHPVFYRF